MKHTVGTCGNCGGAVTVPMVFHSVIPPTPRCEACGAHPKQGHGPVIEMERPAIRTGKAPGGTAPSGRPEDT